MNINNFDECLRPLETPTERGFEKCASTECIFKDCCKKYKKKGKRCKKCPDR